MKIDKEVLKKQRFWFLVPVVVILWLISVFGLMSMQSSANDNWKKADTVDKDLKAMQTDITLRNREWIDQAKTQTGKSNLQKRDLWYQAYDKQNGIERNWDLGVLEAIQFVRSTLAANQPAPETGAAAEPAFDASAATSDAAEELFKDPGQIFSPVTIRRASEELREIKRRFKKDLVIEVYGSIPADRQSEYKKNAQQFLASWVKERSQAVPADGIFVFACRDPLFVQVEAKSEATLKVFPANDQARLRDLLGARLQQDRLKIINPLITWPGDTPLFADKDFGVPLGNVPTEYRQRDGGYYTQFREVHRLANPYDEKTGKGVVCFREGGGGSGGNMTRGSYDAALRVLMPHNWNPDKANISTEEAWMEQERVAILRELMRVIADANDSVAILREEWREVTSEPPKPTAAQPATASATPGNPATAVASTSPAAGAAPAEVAQTTPPAEAKPARPALHRKRYLNTSWQVGVVELSEKNRWGKDWWDGWLLDLELVREGDEVFLTGVSANLSTAHAIPGKRLAAVVSDGQPLKPVEKLVPFDAGDVPPTSREGSRKAYLDLNAGVEPKQIAALSKRQVKVPITGFKDARTIVRVQMMPEKPLIDHQRFANPNWLVEVKLLHKSNRQGEVQGTIYNRSGRRLLPVAFEIRAKDPKEPAKELKEAVEIRIRAAGKYRDKGLEAGEKGEFREDTNWNAPQMLASVKQVLDWRTAPIKRIDRIEIGLIAQQHSDRTNQFAPLLALKQYNFARKAGGTAATPATPAPAASPPTGSGPSGHMPQGYGTLGGPMGGSQGAGPVSRDHEVPLARYTDLEEEVRRAPIAVVMIVDPAYINDVNAAFANSRLRIQLTMTPWTRVMAVDKPRIPASATTPAAAGPKPLQGTASAGAPASMQPRGAVAEEETTLVELQVYGIATIYENPEAEEARKKRAGGP